MGSKLDRNASELVNMTDGGTWTPSSPICIGGRGTILDSSCQITGGITTKPGYGGKKPQIELDDQWPVFSAPRTKTTTVTWHRGEGRHTAPTLATAAGGVARIYWSSGIFPSFLLGDHHMHDGATLTKATAAFRLTGTKPTSFPINRDMLTIRRWNRTTDALAGSLHTNGTVGATVYAGYTAQRNITTAVEYFNGGNVVSLEYVPDQNNVIDKATYFYGFALDVYDDADLLALKLEYTVPSMKWE